LSWTKNRKNDLWTFFSYLNPQNHRHMLQLTRITTCLSLCKGTKYLWANEGKLIMNKIREKIVYFLLLLESTKTIAMLRLISITTCFSLCKGAKDYVRKWKFTSTQVRNTLRKFSFFSTPPPRLKSLQNSPRWGWTWS